MNAFATYRPALRIAFAQIEWVHALLARNFTFESLENLPNLSGANR
jgi:hypothetical protein